jgi:hypothetical protein
MLVEALAALVTALTVLLALTTVLIAYLQRVKTDQSAAEIEDVGSRMAASITQATKTASQWAIYLDRASYLADPVSNVASQGNFGSARDLEYGRRNSRGFLTENGRHKDSHGKVPRYGRAAGETHHQKRARVLPSERVSRACDV